MKMFQAKSVDVEPPVRSPEPLKIGDVVKLKSGGPLMTISRQNDTPLDNGPSECVWCVWFDPDTLNIRSSALFLPACLDIFEDDKGE